MTTYTITKIDTDPQLDPYHRDTGRPTYTELYIDPGRRIVALVQECDDNATPSDEWHGVTITRHVHTWPDAGQAEQVLTDNPLIDRIIADHSTEWDGSNWVGSIGPDGSAALDEIVEALEACSPTDAALWTCDEWFGNCRSELGVTADMTDQELTDLADSLKAAAKTDDAILIDSVYNYLDTLRSELIDERETETE